MVKLIKTDTYYNVFNLLNDSLSKSVNSLDGKNLIFLEEKVSLMVERAICHKFNGSFNTEVYSFGNFLRVNKNLPNVLTREGSSMAIKRILSLTPLKCFKNSKTSLAPTLYQLIIQLKSARVTPKDILDATSKVSGVLKDKLVDIATVYSEYENYLLTNGYEDQSSMLSYLPDVLKNQKDISNTDVYLVGFSSFTSQAREVVKTLLKSAKSVTAILVEGKNPYAYLNETARVFKDICISENIKFSESFYKTSQTKEGEFIANNLFNPLCKTEKIFTDKIYSYTAKNAYEEIEKIAETIKMLVMEGEMRYKDVCVALADFEEYKDHVKSCFERLDIPYFLDEKQKPSNHPLILLILSYLDVFRKGFEKNALFSFIKNPLVNQDKIFVDEFTKYIKKYNLFYQNFLEPLEFSADNEENTQKFEEFRKEITFLFEVFDPFKLLEKLDVKNKLKEHSKKLIDYKQAELSAVNDQIFNAVEKLLQEISTILKGVDVSYAEYRNVFLSGVTALELSIIPQYNDAVFVGGFKETSLSICKCLFVPGLTTSVPSIKDDVALLMDSELDTLSSIKVMIEPKVRVVNHRVKEGVALGISAFSDRLYLSYPLTARSGGKNSKSEVLTFLENAFTIDDFPRTDGYLTKKQALMSFSRDCSDFYLGIIDDIKEASSYYYLNQEDKNLERLAMLSGKSLKVYLDQNKRIVISNVTSPTTIEDYYRCPYKSFLSHGLRIKQDEEGEVTPLSFGNLMHEIFAEYLSNVDCVTDQETSSKLFHEIKDKILSRKEYKRFSKDKSLFYAIERALNECEKFCYKTYTASINSKFKTLKENLEVPFGKFDKDGRGYPAISLLDGKVKLTGKIDRVDTYGDYFRVIDYKTGSADVNKEKLFAGLKLQLYLYALAITDKKVAGMYYLPVNDAFKSADKKDKPMMVGQTLNDEEIIKSQDLTLKEKENSEFLPVSKDKKGEYKGVISKENLDAMISYALKISEKAASQMADGVIVASPYEKACESCPFLALCEREEENGRKVSSVSEEDILNAVQGEGEC